MSEITNLRVLYKNNPFVDIIIPLIEYFNPAQKTTTRVNPWSALAAGALLANRSLQWGTGYVPLKAVNYKKCCCPNEDPSQGTSINCEYQRITQQGGGPPCPACASEITAAASVVQGLIITQEELIKLGSRDEGFDDPYTPEIRKFEKQLMGMSMNASNDYVFFQQMVDAFYNNVGFIYYFTNTFKEGQYSSLYLGMLGGDIREGYRTNGITVDTITDGGGGTPGSPGNTDLTFNFVAAEQDGDYILITTSTTVLGGTIDQIWFNVGAGIAPTLHVQAGYVVSLVEVVLDPFDGTADNALNVQNAFEDTSDYASVTAVGSTVTWVPNYDGSRLASDFANITGEWIGAFVDGTDAVAGDSEVTSINYAEASLGAMYGTWFKMYGADDDGVLFYYETTASPIDPATLGVAFTTPVAINLNDTGCVVHPPLDGQFVTPCPNSNATPQEMLAKITGDAIIGTGLFLAAGYAEKCCQCTPCKDYAGNPCTPPESPECCGPCNKYGAVSALALLPSEGGTATVGPANQVMDVISPAGTNWGTAFSDADYVDLWNANVPAEMKALGRPTHYYKSAGSSGGSCYKALADPCPSGCSPTGTYCRCDQPCDSAVGSVLLQTAYLAVTDQMSFNRPGVTSWNGQAEPCNTCLM
jgi:hypothetical protein